MIQDGWFQRHLPWLGLISIRPYCALSNVLLMYFHKNTAVQHGHSKSSVACDLGINYSYSYRNIGGTTLSKDLKIRGKIDSFRMWHSLEEGVGDGR